MRTWGFWTRAKLSILENYLERFLTVSKSQQERVFLDAFAGEGHGVERMTLEKFKGSPRIALDAGPVSFTRLAFFEFPEHAEALRTQLEADYGGREFKVYPGDCNITIPQALSELREVSWAPTFAFLDPDGMELEWKTLEALASHKRGYRKGSEKPEYKVEMWMLFPSGGFVRTLALDPSKVSLQHRKPPTILRHRPLRYQ
jgi:three-Cys-motif partner protein